MSAACSKSGAPVSWWGYKSGSRHLQYIVHTQVSSAVPTLTGWRYELSRTTRNQESECAHVSLEDKRSVLFLRILGPRSGRTNCQTVPKSASGSGAKKPSRTCPVFRRCCQGSIQWNAKARVWEGGAAEHVRALQVRAQCAQT